MVRWLQSTGIHVLQMVRVLRPVLYRYSSGTEPRKIFQQKTLLVRPLQGTGSDVKDERKDLTDKADPIREHDCIWCMACVSVCPPAAIKVDQSNVEKHEGAAKTL